MLTHNKNNLQLSQRCPIYLTLQKLDDDTASASTSTQNNIDFNEECKNKLFNSIKELQDHFLNYHSEYIIKINEV